MFLRNISKFSALVVLLSICQYSYQQSWQNDNVIKQWEQMPSNVASGVDSNLQAREIDLNNSPQMNSYLSEQESQNNNKNQQPSPNSGLGSLIGSVLNSNEFLLNSFNANLQAAAAAAQNAQQQQQQQASYNNHQQQQQVIQTLHPIGQIQQHLPVLPSIAVVPVRPFAIQQPTITNTGETIIENLIGGIHFDCRGKPTGHWRDSKYCDLFHACVYGQQRKTYACPIVGERTYFDEVTRRCEFVNRNPLGCGLNAYYH